MALSNTIHCDKAAVIVDVPNNLAGSDEQVTYVQSTETVRVVHKRRIRRKIGHSHVTVKPEKVSRGGRAKKLFLEFNPSKVRGMNGLSDDLAPFEAVTDVIRSCCDCLGLHDKLADRPASARYRATLRKLHLTGHFKVGSVHDVIETLKQYFLDQGLRISSEGQGRTLYVNRSDGHESRYWVLVFYDKHLELLQRRPKGLSDREYECMLSLAEGVLRVELRLNSKWLSARELDRLAAWENLAHGNLFMSFLTKVGVDRPTVRPTLTEDEEQILSNVEKRDLALWLKGGDLRKWMDRRTFLKRASSLKRKIGVYIDRPNRPRKADQIELAQIFRKEALLPHTYWLK